MKFKVNTIDVINRLYGNTGFTPVFSSNRGVEVKHQAGKFIEVDDAAYTSYLGTPIHQLITFKGSEEYEDLILDDWPLITIDLPRNIVKTKLVKKDGTNKEFISNDDYAVSIKGVLVNPDSEVFPYDQVAAFNKMMRRKVSHEVECRLLQVLGIHNLVIDDAKLSIVEGFTNMMGYQISASSDDPIEIRI